MDLSKLIDILHRKSLFFTRSDKLGDPWEGGTSRVNIQQRPERYGSHGPGLRHLAESGSVSEFKKAVRKHTYISCWHENSIESAAMWKLYLKSDEGIAVQTKFDRLKRCFHKEEKTIYIGNAHYYDPNADELPEGNTMRQFLFKLKSYQHENETRAIYQDYSGKLGFAYDEPAGEYGLHIAADLDILIENIYLAPTTPRWLVDVVQAVVNQFGIDRTVKLSKLAEAPVF